MMDAAGGRDGSRLASQPNIDDEDVIDLAGEDHRQGNDLQVRAQRSNIQSLVLNNADTRNRLASREDRIQALPSAGRNEYGLGPMSSVGNTNVRDSMPSNRPYTGE